jgi:hypothetical protein
MNPMTGPVRKNMTEMYPVICQKQDDTIGPYLEASRNVPFRCQECKNEDVPMLMLMLVKISDAARGHEVCRIQKLGPCSITE